MLHVMEGRRLMSTETQTVDVQSKLGGDDDVRGSFSARGAKSSFARVRRILVPHMEEEGEEQENEKEDEREDGKQRAERSVVENQATHNMSA